MNHRQVAASAGMIALYIFDMGGVVSLGTDVSARISDFLSLDRPDLRELTRAEFDSLVRGQITVAEFWRRFSRLTGREVEEDLWGTLFQPRPNRAVLELVQGLKEKGRVVVGTNTIAPHYRIHQENGDYAVFDAVYASHLIGLAKPDPAFYNHILGAEGCRPEQAVFIDDLEANVAAGRQLGIHALLYRSAGRLRRQLRQLQGDGGP